MMTKKVEADWRLHINLKRILLTRGITVTAISRRTQIPVQTLHNWLSAQEPKRISQLKRLTDYLNVSIDTICFGGDLQVEKIGNVSLDNEVISGVFEVTLKRVSR